MDADWHRRVDEVGAYLDGLIVEIEKREKRENDARQIYLVAWIAWTTCGFIAHEWIQLFEIFFFFALVYSFMRSALKISAVSEFCGAVKILELLGLIPPADRDRYRKEIRKWNVGIDMVKRWVMSKKEAQEKVYAPA